MRISVLIRTFCTKTDLCVWTKGIFDICQREQEKDFDLMCTGKEKDDWCSYVLGYPQNSGLLGGSCFFLLLLFSIWLSCSRRLDGSTVQTWSVLGESCPSLCSFDTNAGNEYRRHVSRACWLDEGGPHKCDSQTAAHILCGGKLSEPENPSCKQTSSLQLFCTSRQLQMCNCSLYGAFVKPKSLVLCACLLACSSIKCQSCMKLHFYDSHTVPRSRWLFFWYISGVIYAVHAGNRCYPHV